MPIIDPNDFDFWKFTNDVFTVQSVTTTLGPRYTFGEFLDRAAHLSDDYKFTSYKVFSKGQLDLMLGELRNAFLNPSAAPKTPPIPFLTAGCEARRQFIPPGLLADDDGAMKAEETGDTTNRSKEMLIFASAGASSWYAYPARDRAWYLLLDGAATLYEPIADPHPIDPRKGLGELAKRYNDSTDKEAFQFEGQVREHPLTLGAAV